jgi:hypothetical protein
MARDTETLSTRDLASPSEPASDTMPEGDRRDTAAPEGQPGVYDQTAPGEEGAPLPANEPTAAAAAEQTRPESTEPVATQDQDAQPAPPWADEAGGGSTAGGSLLPAEMDSTFQQRWKEIQTRFVDEPRGAVEDADSLVATLMQQLAEGFAKERERLEAQWGRGEDISTEDLRVALQRYRTFFQRLLST